MSDNHAIFVAGGQCQRYDVDTDALLGELTGWDAVLPGVAAAGLPIDAVVDLGQGFTYAFSGSSYLRLRTETGELDDPNPLDIGTYWNGFAAAGFAAGVDAAVNWLNGKVYFFRGHHYLRFDIEHDRVDADYPKPVSGNWGGLEQHGFDTDLAAVLSPANGQAYFFKAGGYVRVGRGSRRMNQPARPVVDFWPGLATVGFTGSLDTAWTLAPVTAPPGQRETADLDDAFFVELAALCGRLGCDPQHLLGVMMSESGVLPDAQNPHGKATGLIQFMPNILEGLGWTDGPDAFRGVNATDQLPYVEKFFQPYARFGLDSPGRLYQATFLPGTMKSGQGPDFVLCAHGGHARLGVRRQPRAGCRSGRQHHHR